MTIYAHNNLFIQNKYYTWYHQIIDKARTKNYDGYSEVHHIIPSSLGGSDEPDNLIRLSYPEHFLCHWLLIKFVRTKRDKVKMIWALNCMTGANDKNGRQVTSWQFDAAKRAAKDNMSGVNSPSYGKKHFNNGIKAIQLSEGEEIPEGFVPGRLPISDETRHKLRDNTRGKKFYNNGINSIMLSDGEEIPEGFVLGALPRSEEHSRKLRDNTRGKKFYNNGIKEIMISDGEEIPEGFVLGRSEEHRRKLGDNIRGRKYYNNGIKSIRLSEGEEIPEGFVLGGLSIKRPS